MACKMFHNIRVQMSLRFLEASKSNFFDHFPMFIFVVFFPPCAFLGGHSCSTQVLNILEWYLFLPQQAGRFLMRVFDLAVAALAAAAVFLVLVPVVGPVIVPVRVLVLVLALVLVLVLDILLVLAIFVAFVVAAVVVIPVFVCVCFCS